MSKSREEVNEWFEKHSNAMGTLKAATSLTLTVPTGESITIPNDGLTTLRVDYEDGTHNGCKTKGKFFIDEVRLAINDWGFTPESGVPIVL